MNTAHPNVTAKHWQQAATWLDGWFAELSAVFKLYWLHWLASFAITAALALSAYVTLDVKIARFFYQKSDNLPKAKAFKRLAGRLTHYGKTEWYALPALLVYLIVNRLHPEQKTASQVLKRCRRAAVSMMMTLSASGLIVNSIKPVFARPRPKVLFNEGSSDFSWFDLGYNYGSFPSGHSATSVGAWLLLGMMVDGYIKWLFLTFGIGLASTRMIIHAHYLSDVISGSAIGAAVAVLVYQTLYIDKAD